MSEYLSLPEAIASVHDIAAHHQISEMAIFDFFALALKDQSPHQDDLFADVTSETIKQMSQERLAENNRLASLALLTCLDAVFMADYYQRIQKREKSLLGRAFRDLNKECDNNKKRGYGKTHPSFEYDILELWKKERSETKDIISYLKKIFKYRHWLAHGRFYFFREEWKKYDFQEIYTVAQALLGFF